MKIFVRKVDFFFYIRIREKTNSKIAKKHAIARNWVNFAIKLNILI